MAQRRHKAASVLLMPLQRTDLAATGRSLAMKNVLNAASAGRRLIPVKNRHGRNVKAILRLATDRRLMSA
jgi:hypothetical protein